MNLSEILLSIAAAVGTLTPLTLGLLKYFGDKKEDATPAPPATPDTPSAPTVGDSVDFESVAVKALNAQIEFLVESHRDLKGRLQQAATDKLAADAHIARVDANNRAVTAQRDAAYDQLRRAGLRP